MFGLTAAQTAANVARVSDVVAEGSLVRSPSSYRHDTDILLIRYKGLWMAT